jgi:hypothetical protein
MLVNRKAVLTGLGLGAGLMYFLDPDRGGRRRALVRDKLARARRVGGDAVGAASRDFAHRATGAAARLRGLLNRESIVDDGVLVERVRATLGRVVSHPHAIRAEAAGGIVTLRGPVLRAEVRPLLKAVQDVPGVRQVVSELEEHEQPGNIPALQGGSERPGV